MFQFPGKKEQAETAAPLPAGEEPEGKAPEEKTGSDQKEEPDAEVRHIEESPFSEVKHMQKENFDSAAKRREKVKGWKKQRTAIRRLLHRLILGIQILVILLISLTIGIAAYEYSRRIPIGSDSHILIGCNYQEVSRQLSQAGFQNIRLEVIEDLPASSSWKQDQVTSIRIGWLESFHSDTKMPSNLPVVITYHTLQKIGLPFSSRNLKGKKYETILKQLQNAGFSNVRTEARYDLLLGWLRKDGEVESVTVDGSSTFSAGDFCQPDVEIIITYHTYRSNRPG